MTVDSSCSRRSLGKLLERPNHWYGSLYASTSMHGADYSTSKDNVWNTAWFYQKAVSATPATTKLELARTVHSWNTVLKGYLEEIGAIDWL